MTRWPLHTGVEQWSLGLEFWSPTLSHSTFLWLLLEDRPAADLSFSATWLVSPWLGNLRPHPPGTWEAPGLLTPAALDGEAEETQLASVTALALNPRATGALPGLGVAPVLLGAQRVTLAARMRKEPGSEISSGPQTARGLGIPHAAGEAPSPHGHTSNSFPQDMSREAQSHKNATSVP